MSDSQDIPAAESPAAAGDRASFAEAFSPVITIVTVLAAVIALAWVILRFAFPGLAVLLATALTALSTTAGIAIIVSADDGVSHDDGRAQDMVGLALAIAIIGPAAGLITLLFVMF